MQIKIRFLGILSVKYGSVAIRLTPEADYEALVAKIRGLIGADGPAALVILKNGKPASPSEPLKDGDEYCVFSPISGG